MRRQRPRRGLVLMLVLTLLTLFALMAVTFVIVTGLYEDSSKAHVKQGLRGDPPAKLLDRALYDLVRDTNDQGSPIRLHSLLMDMYGVDVFNGASGRIGTKGVLSNQRLLPDTGNQFVQYNVSFAGGALPFDNVRGYYEGCVITFTSGNAKNLSSRIVHYDQTSGGPTPYIVRFLVPRNDQGLTVLPGNGANFIINGRPFNGTGFGYNPTTGRVDASTNPGTAPPIALLPNTSQNGNTGLYWGVSNGGDADESYDAADFQNMILAALIPNPGNENQIAFVVPSFHRPALVNFFRNQWSGSPPGNAAALMRQFILRPLPTDHPNFTGGNPNPKLQAPTNIDNVLQALSIEQAWDVDNDGDGVMDSIWLDLGYPSVTDAGGRSYKPLFAVLCTDLDGRLNVNAHGNLWHTAGQSGGIGTSPPAAVAVAGGNNTSSLAGGPGLGPPAITLAALGINATQYRVNLLQARYGPDGGTPRPGFPLTYEPLSIFRLFDTPANYFRNPVFTAYQSPPDLRDRLAYALDHFGQPVYERDPEGAGTDLRFDLDYELDHSPDAPRGENSGKDALFTYSELERLLRVYDADAYSLPGRLDFLKNPALASALGPANCRVVTTDSYDPPVPNIRLTRDMINQIINSSGTTAQPNQNTRAYHFVDLLRFRLLNGGASPALTQQQIDNEIAKMVPFDLRRGLRWDVNMPFGNGQENNGNRVADEHGWVGLPPNAAGPPPPFEERGTSELMPAIPGVVPSGVPFNHTNQLNVNINSTTSPLGGTVNDVDRSLTRHLYARYLYVLMMTLSDPNVYIPQFELDVPPNNTTNPQERALGFAQWAVNVVDFRDADSIMTPFEYDINPFNGWNVDGVLTTTSDPERGVVWGCERPELLITETIAFHDRRTEDLDTEPPMGQGKTTANGDDDFDQRLRPRGSFFVELFNPWTSPSLTKPGELYETTYGGVDLTRTSGPNNTPVWRILVIDGDANTQSLDPDHPIPALRLPSANVERGIYFTNPSALGGNQHGRQKYWSSKPVAPIRPGRYAVAGGFDYSDGTDYVTPLGRLTTTTEMNASSPAQYNSTRRIVLRPNANPGSSNARVPAPNSYMGEPSSGDYLQPTGIVIDMPLPISVTEPLNGYAGFDAANPPPAPSTWVGPSADHTDGQYEDGAGMVAPLDEPIDRRRANGNPELAPLLNNGTTPRFRTIQLQRLANPLAGWNAATNPYRTIDTASVDLIAFNGITADESGDTNINDGNMVVSTHQRGDKTTAMPRGLWRHEPPRSAADFAADDPQAGTGHIFDYALRHSLGYLNQRYRPMFTAAQAMSYPHPYNSSGTAYYRGAPNTLSGPTFPWLTWNNRPFNSDLEMMQVPYLHSSRWLFNYSFASGVNPYDPTQTGQPGQTGQFSHLLNFYQTGPNPNQATNLYRLFEFTHVPSKFVSSDTVLNAGWFTASPLPNGNPNPMHGDSGRGTQQYHPPYNKVSNYRDPGRVNINTIYSPRVWQALFVDGFGPQFSPGPGFFGGGGLAGWVDSRRGYGGAASAQNQLDPKTPTLFSNPLRSVSASDLVPLPTMVRADVETTLLRSNTVGTSLIPGGIPLFEFNSGNTPNDPNRNPYFRTQPMQRLSNLVTSRSNVYAIWITVGYFEVNPNTQQLGRELGSDSGEVQRHRAFYIVDRSIPVAFEPGVNHNVDKAIRLRRFIE